MHNVFLHAICIYTSDVIHIDYGSFLIEESLSSFLSCRFFHTSLPNSSNIYVIYTCFNRVNHLLSILLFIQEHPLREILRLLEKRYIYCVDLDLDLNFMHRFAS